LCDRAGIEVQEWRAFWPSVVEWGCISPLSQEPADAMGTGSKERVANRLLRIAKSAGVQDLLVPGYLVIGRNRGKGAAPVNYEGSVLDRIAKAEGMADFHKTTISARWNSQSISFANRKKFVKVPLTSTALAGADAQRLASEELAQHPVGRFIPLPIELKEVAGVSYLVCRVVPSQVRAAVGEETLNRLLEALSHGSRRVRLSTTDFWERIFDPGIKHSLLAFGAASALDYVERSLAGRYVVAGVSHGDLGSSNVLLDGGRPYVIDWDRYERNSPLLLDAMAAACSLVLQRERSRTSDTVLEMLKYVLRGDPRLPLNHRIFGGIDELSPPEMVALFVLNAVSWKCRYHGLDLPESRREQYRNWVSLCGGVLVT
jgi:hypothetical protein